LVRIGPAYSVFLQTELIFLKIFQKNQIKLEKYFAEKTEGTVFDLKKYLWNDGR